MDIELNKVGGDRDRPALNDFLNKLSSYNLFNYLFSGVVFCLILDKFFSYSLIQKDIVIGVFLYYFVGLVISRVGSLVIEPILKKAGFVIFADYTDFMSALKNDPKLETFPEVNNMYRTIVALFFSVSLIAGYQAIQSSWPLVAGYSKYATNIGLLFMFLFSYKKQTQYIYKRVISNKD